MRKLFLISLMALCTCVMAWAGHQPEPKAFAHQEVSAQAAHVAKAPKAVASVENQLIYLDYGTTHQEFNTLQAAFNALPDNSTPATVKIMTDIAVNFEGSYVQVQKFQNVTLNLNGHEVSTTTALASGSQLVMNYGTLTIVDEVGTGVIRNYSANADPKGVPTYGNYTIVNRGTLILNSGTIENTSSGSACYAVENETEWGCTHNTTFIMNGGKVKTAHGAVVRQYAGWNDQTVNTVEIHGGIIEGSVCGVNIQYQGNPNNANQYVDKQVTFLMTGGQINLYHENPTSNYTFLVVDDFMGVPSRQNTRITITGGTTNGGLEAEGTETMSISGGTFGTDFKLDYSTKFISGGTFDAHDQEVRSKYWTLSGVKQSYPGQEWADWWEAAAWEAAGYVVEGDIIYSVTPSPHATLIECIKAGYCPESVLLDDESALYRTTVAPCNSQTVTEDKTMAEIAQEIEDANKEVSASIIVIDATTEDEHAVVTVTDNIAVEGIVINTEDGKKEGQIVVESGVTLTVGNSGIVSENDDLTTVVVKPGGTVIVGNGGVTQDGDATPVEIQSTGTESGVFMVDPNAPTEVAEAPAKVKVYTRAFRNGSIAHWQQMASPVKGDSKNSNKITIKPDQDVFTVMYRWDYPTDSWAMIDELPYDGTYKGFYSTGWETTDEVIKPFAAYDLINNSTNGGVTYEFAGELVGNGDMTLNFPESGFCVFGNSYTAPIDLSTLFAKITNDMAQANIDPCVYMYNSTADRFESVNSLGLWLKELGIMDVAFSQIPPQQAFVMNLLSGNSAQSAVDYATCVWGNPNTNKNTPILAPKRQQAPTFSALLNIIVSDGEATDRVVLVEDEKYSAAYDNGADAQKYMQGAFNIYAVTEAGELAMVAADDIENTALSFKAGNAVNYTMNFNNVEGDYVLVDRLNNAQVAMTEGGTYVFAAQPNSTMEGRFAIVTAAKMPTAIENTDVKANVKGIYTIMGQYVGENFDILPAGAYIVNGVKIIK